jgi:hypothetical protein
MSALSPWAFEAVLWAVFSVLLTCAIVGRRI